MALTAEEILAVKGEHLEHAGVRGMHWGQRRYQNPDGSLTALGRIHYGIGKRREARAVAKKTKVMQSGDAKTVLKYRKKLTDEEFDTAMARVAKTEALRTASNAEKNAKKQAKQQDKLTKEQRKSAEKIAEANAKTKTNSKDFWGTLGEWGKRAATIASLYKSVSTITTGFGIDMPKFGSKDKTKNAPKVEPKNSAKAPESKTEGSPFAEKKSEAFDDISNNAWDMGKRAFNEFKNTSTASDMFSSFVEGIGRSAANPGKEHRTSDNNFWDGVSEIIDADWTEVKSTPVSDILALPYNDKWLK